MVLTPQTTWGPSPIHHETPMMNSIKKPSFRQTCRPILPKKHHRIPMPPPTQIINSTASPPLYPTSKLAPKRDSAGSAYLGCGNTP